MKENFIWQPLAGVLQCILNQLYIFCTVAGKILENRSVKPHAAWGFFWGWMCLFGVGRLICFNVPWGLSLPE